MKNLKPILFLILFCGAICAGAYYLINQEQYKSTPASNPISQGIAQYSDLYITENAKNVDNKYSHISFAEPKIESVGPLGGQLASVLDAFKFLVSKPKEVSKNEYGVWVWTPTLEMTTEYMSSLLDNVEKDGVNVAYLSIDSYLDIYMMPEGLNKIKMQEKFNGVLEQFIALARERDIKVDAEAGWKNWAEDGHTYKPFIIASFVKSFNDTHEDKFRGFQYDIEPYLLDRYKSSDEGKKIVLTKFVKLVNQTVDYLSDSTLRFSVVVPDFYDGRDEMTPKFTYAGREDYVFKHLLRILDKKKDSSIIIMSYRNFAEGRDGSIDVSKNEMRTARLGVFNTAVILAQETGDVPPAYITFHNTSKYYFKIETSKLRSAFLTNPNFGGIAVHYANAFMSLK